MLIFNKIKTTIKNITYLVSGNFISLMLGLLFNIYIAKMLGASAYGIYNTVGAFVAMFGFFVFEGYQKVAVREACGDQDRLITVVENILGIKTLFSVFSVLITIFASLLFDYNKATIVYICIFSLNFVFGSISSILKTVFHVNLKMKYIAYVSLIQKLIYIIPAGICIWFGGGVIYLVICYTLATFSEIFVSLYYIKTHFNASFSFKKIIKSKFNIIYFKEAFVLSLLGFIGYFHSTIDITMLSWMVSAESVGLYAAANKLVWPLQLLGRMTKMSIFPLFIKRFHSGQQVPGKTLFKISGLIVLIMFPIALFVSFFSKEIIFFTFGEEFYGASEILKYLCWMVSLGLAGLPFATSMMANHHEKKLIIPNIMRSLSNVILNYFFIKKYGYMGAVYSTVITYFWYHIFINFVYQYYVLKKAGNIV